MQYIYLRKYFPSILKKNRNQKPTTLPSCFTHIEQHQDLRLKMFLTTLYHIQHAHVQHSIQGGKI